MRNFTDTAEPGLIELNHSGDVKLSWDPDDPEDVKNAKDHFERLRKEGHIFYKLTATKKKGQKTDEFPEKESEMICEFDPKAAEILSHKVPSGG